MKGTKYDDERLRRLSPIAKPQRSGSFTETDMWRIRCELCAGKQKITGRIAIEHKGNYVASPRVSAHWGLNLKISMFLAVICCNS